MFDPTNWTGFHTWLSLIALFTGFVVLFGMMGGKDRPFWVGLFLLTAVATSATGFGFPFTGVLPSHIVGVAALAVLAVTLPARYHFHKIGHWRWIYVLGVVISLYLLSFVGVAQAFLKVPVLNAMAPTQAEPPFAIAQGAVLLLFVLMGFAALRGSRRPPLRAAYR